MVSLWKRIKFVLAKTVTKDRVRQLTEVAKIAIAKGEEGLDQRYVHGPEAESALKLAEASGKLVECLRGYDEAIVRAGPLLVVKVTVDGKSRLAVETVSVRLRRLMDENPRLLEDPKLLFRELEKMKAPVRELTKAAEPFEDPLESTG